jgi:hypothetical protein
MSTGYHKEHHEISPYGSKITNDVRKNISLLNQNLHYKFIAFINRLCVFRHVHPLKRKIQELLSEYFFTSREFPLRGAIS